MHWIPIAASVTGAQHVRAGRPNQDRYTTRRLRGDASAVAIADGHGGRRYSRAAAGAQFAVDVAVDVAVGVAAELNDELNGSELTGSQPAGSARGWDSVPDVPQRLAEAWNRAVEDDLTRHPLSEAERGLLEGRPDVVAYGCTLVLTVLHGGGGVTWQIGDGDVLLVHGDEPARGVVPGDARLVGNATTSMCGDHAAADFRAATWAAGRETLLLMATDGYGNAFADAQWQQQVMADFLRHLRTGGADLVATHLPDWLRESAQAGGDDVTVLLAYGRSDDLLEGDRLDLSARD